MMIRMRTRFAVLTFLGIFLAMGCTKKPTAEECQQAVNHMFEILQKESAEEMKRNAERMGVQVPQEAANKMEETRKEMQNNSTWTFVNNAHLQACKRQPQTRTICINNAKTLNELVEVCGMKPSTGGPRGGVTISWPD
jgi:hypothetical protein